MKRPMQQQPREANGSSVIDHALAVLRCFSPEEPLLGVTDIAHRGGLHKSSVSRILATLENSDLVERDERSRRFRLGLGLITVSGPLLATLDVRRAAYAHLQELTARTGETADGRAEISAIIVPNGTEGFTVEPPYRKLGWHISDTHGLTFEGARVPEAHLLGERGHGFKQFLKTLDDGRIAIAALAVGCLQRMLEETTRYSQERLAFGKPIAVNQGVSFQVADIAMMTEIARQLTYKAAWLKEQQHAGKRSVAEVKQAAAYAKLYATEAAVTATRMATQIFGGNGFMEEYPVARFYRDAKILEIGEGTSEVQRMVIARGLGLPS